MKPIAPTTTVHQKHDRKNRSDGVHIPENWCYHYLFDAQAALTPQATAVIFEDQRLTYRQLNEQANQLAHYLQSLGVGPNVPVGICLERSLALPVAYLAVFKAGGACLSLEPDYPTERLAFMLTDAQVPVLLSQARLQADLPPHQAEVICLDTEWPQIAQQRSTPPYSGVTPEHLAFINYTSGSTGQPKGVLVPHRARVSRLLKRQELCQLAPTDRHLLKSPISFGPLIRELFWPLLTGGCMVIARPGGHQDPAYLLDLIAGQKITVMNFVPSLLRHFLEQPDIETTCHSLRHVFCGGEALPAALRDRFLDRLPATHLHQFYGLTEVAVITHLLCNEERGQPVASIGRPTDLPLYFLDEQRRPVAEGEPGEIYVGGVGLAKGYLNRPDLTAERFVANPFSPNPAERLYRTGDLGRLLPDGRVEFLGRADQQLKIRGVRVEVGEIEAVLSRHPQVRQAAVRPKTVAEEETRLVAFVEPIAEQAPTPAELRSWAARNLPAVMVPEVYLLLEALPLTPSGKIDRRALPLPAELPSQLPADREVVAPRSQTEVTLVEIWQSVLQIEPVGLQDNFFELGGHSLLALRLLGHLEQAFNRRVALADFLQNPTVAQLAHYLDHTDTTSQRASLITLRTEGSQPPFFWLPGNMGNVFTDLSTLAYFLGSDQPVYGLQDDVANPSRVDKLARHYLAEIRAIQPTGPYRLGGICAGAVVAFEMAQQLHRQGEAIALLALVEPSPPRQPSLAAFVSLAFSMGRRLMRRSRHHTQAISQLGAGQQRDYARSRLKALANRWGLRLYRPQPYPHRLDLFLTSESLKRSHNPQLKWQALSHRPVTLHEIPGSHNTITGKEDTPLDEQALQILAEKVQGCLEPTLLRQQPG